MLIEEIQQIIQTHLLKDKYETFQDFIKHHSNPQFLSVCQSSWETPALIITCHTCQIKTLSCYCLDCFFKGNHKNHSFQSWIAPSGNCDCGDSQFIRPTGFCSVHHGSSNSPHRDQLNDEIITSVQEFSKEICSKVDENNSELIFSTLSQLVSTGDGMRRCVVLGISDFINQWISKLVQIHNLKFVSSLIHFFGQLINDDLFRKLFSQSIYLNCNEIIHFLSSSISANQLDLSFLKPFPKFLFHIFHFENFREFCQEETIDCPNFLAELFTNCHTCVINYFDTSASNGKEHVSCWTEFNFFIEFFSQYNQQSLSQKFFELLFEKDLKNEGQATRNSISLTLDDSRFFLMVLVK